MSIGNDSNGDSLGNRVSYEGVNTSMRHGSFGTDSGATRPFIELFKTATGRGGHEHPYGDLNRTKR